MTETSDPDSAPPRKSAVKRLFPILLPLIALLAGLGVSYAGFFSPMKLLSPAEHTAEATVAVPDVTFVDVPRIVLSLGGDRVQTLALTVMIDVDPASAAQARTLMPRITDSYNGFLSKIDPAAFSRRGILEIVRAELATRTRFILGDNAVNDLLITEFRVQ